MVSPTLLVFVDLDRSGIGVMPFDLGLSAVLLVIRLGSGFWGEDHTGGVPLISSHLIQGACQQQDRSLMTTSTLVPRLGQSLSGFSTRKLLLRIFDTSFIFYVLNPNLSVLFPNEFPFCLNHSLQPPLQARPLLPVPRLLLEISRPRPCLDSCPLPTQSPPRCEWFFKNASWIMVPLFSVLWILFRHTEGAIPASQHGPRGVCNLVCHPSGLLPGTSPLVLCSNHYLLPRVPSALPGPSCHIAFFYMSFLLLRRWSLSTVSSFRSQLHVISPGEIAWPLAESVPYISVVSCTSSCCLKWLVLCGILTSVPQIDKTETFLCSLPRIQAPIAEPAP